MLFLVGCMNDYTGYTYTEAEARQKQDIEYGIVKNLEMVTIKKDKSLEKNKSVKTGAIAGSVLGALIPGKRIAGAVLGGVAGAVTGKVIQESMKTSKAMNLFIQLSDSGENISIIQQNDRRRPIQVGSCVAILRNNETNASRVILAAHHHCYQENN